MQPKFRGPDIQRRPAIDGWLTRSEAATYLGVSHSSLAHWSCEGRGPRKMLIGRRNYYTIADLDAWLVSRADIVRGR